MKKLIILLISVLVLNTVFVKAETDEERKNRMLKQARELITAMNTKDEAKLEEALDQIDEMSDEKKLQILQSFTTANQVGSPKEYNQLVLEVKRLRSTDYWAGIREKFFEGGSFLAMLTFGNLGNYSEASLKEQLKGTLKRTSGSIWLKLFTIFYVVPSLFLAAVEGYEWSQIRNINSVIKKYTKGDFKNLPLLEAAIVLGAYKKDRENLILLAPEVDSFLKQEGVIKALTALYFGNARSKKVKEFEALIYSTQN